jgi:P22 tail accessory factor.
MTTVSSLVQDALGHLGVIDAGEAVPADQMAQAIRALNLMMRRFEANGLALGWTDVSTATAALPLPPEAEEAMGYHLAIRLCARYGRAIAPEIVQMATDGLAALRADVAARDAARIAYDLPGCGSDNGLAGFLAGY